MKSQLNQLGEIVSWTAPHAVQISTLRSAMEDAGIDKKMARDMRPSNAFRRSIYELEENRVIRMVNNDDDTQTYQFTHETLSSLGDEFLYAKEAQLVLDKRTGSVSCTDSGIESVAQRLIREQMQKRGAADVTRIIKKLFSKNGDLFPIREAGAVYFVPQKHVDLCDQTEQMLNAIGGSMQRWLIDASPRHQTNVAESINDALKRMIDEYQKYAGTLASDDPKALSKGMKKINAIRMKLDAYDDVLSSFSGEIRKTVGQITRELTMFVNGQSTMSDAAPVETEQPSNDDDSHDDEFVEEKEPESVGDILALFS